MAANGADIARLAQQAAGMQVAPVVMAVKQKPGQRAAAKLEITTNVRGVIAAKNIPVFRYDVRVLEDFGPKRDGTSAVKEITKQTKEDYLSIDRKNKCVAVFRYIRKKEAAFFGKMECLVYDRASILYSLDKLKVANGETKTFTIPPSELPAETVNPECKSVIFNIKPCDEDFQLSTNDLNSTVNLDVDRVNRSLLQFYELLCSQEAFFAEGKFVSYGTGQSYLIDPNQFGFNDRDMPELPEGKYVGVGAAKGVRVIEGCGGPNRANISLCMDIKKSAFHIDHQQLIEKAASIMGMNSASLRIDAHQIPIISRALKGLFVRCNYGKYRCFQVAGFDRQSASQMRITVDGKPTTIADYYEVKLGIRLKEQRLPLVVERIPNKGNNFYPMEVLTVCENQRVKQTQQSAKQVQIMIKACATLPANRARQTDAMTAALNLTKGANNAWLKESNIGMSEKISMTTRVLPPPTVVYGQNHAVTVNGEKASWMAGRNHYLVPASCDRWYAVALMGGRDHFDAKNFQAYLSAFANQCAMRGMRLSRPMETAFVKNATEKDMETHMIKAKQMGAKFIHFIQGDSLKFHPQMKLLESGEQIVTQDLTARTAEQAPHKSQTMDNIVNKTNLKLGGINFDLVLSDSAEAKKWLARPDRLIVGIDIAHAPKSAVRGKDQSSVPSVVGYSSNCRDHPIKFVGGYRYALAEAEELRDHVISDLLVESMNTFKENRKALPNHLIILRDGISEGQYKYVKLSEVEGVKRACGIAGGPQYRPHITFLVATKNHNVRLYRKNIPQGGRAAEQNVTPGTVVDQTIVSPVYMEFYLNSHSAFQGTAKTPRYNIIFDTSKMSSDEVEGIVFGLAYNHQIVNAAISLPAPILVADRMATRGRNNYIAQFGDSSESTDNGSLPNCAELNAQLGYTGKPLSAVRFNA